MLHNKIILTGRVLTSPKYSEGLSGVITASFKLWHESKQNQLEKTEETHVNKNNNQHKVAFSIYVSTAYKNVIEKLKQHDFLELRLKPVYVEIYGYLASRKNKQNEEYFVLHAYDIKFIKKEV